MTPLLIFDGDCGFCTAAVNFLRRWVKPQCEILPWQQLDLSHYPVTQQECEVAVQFIASNGSVCAGAQAIMSTLRTSATPWPTLAKIATVPPLPWLADLSYHFLAQHRHRLPGATPACAAPLARS